MAAELVCLAASESPVLFTTVPASAVMFLLPTFMYSSSLAKLSYMPLARCRWFQKTYLGMATLCQGSRGATS